jgi:hypothetical protein
MVTVNSGSAGPESWYSQIEKTKDKSRRLLRKVIAFESNSAVIVGKLEDVTLDKLFKANYPFVKITLSKAKKYNLQGKLERALNEEQICFANKPQMILDIDELSKRYPEIHEDTHVEIRRGRFD